MPQSSRTFDKRPLPLDEQIALLKQRGLSLPDEDRARHYIKHIGYYRLSGYMLPFQRADRTDNHHQFIPGTTFQHILDTNTFDRKLRLLIMDAVERIEIALKSIIVNEMCVPYGSHWYMNREHFVERFDFDTFIRTLHKDIDHGKEQDKVRNISIRHYYQNYDSPVMPPLWMVFEALTFGTVSLIYAYLPHADQKRIADQFGLPVPILKSWLHTTSNIRNLCAHHSRLWNRVFTFKPMAPRGKEADFTPNALFYAQAVMLNVLMHCVSPESEWAVKLKDLLEEYPGIPKDRMGFPDGWQGRNIWNFTGR